MVTIMALNLAISAHFPLIAKKICTLRSSSFKWQMALQMIEEPKTNDRMNVCTVLIPIEKIIKTIGNRKRWCVRLLEVINTTKSADRKAPISIRCSFVLCDLHACGFSQVPVVFFTSSNFAHNLFFYFQ